MNRAELRNAVVTALKSIAPESDPASLDDATPFREALDLDSMDFLNVLVALHRTVQIDIPESDYAKVQTLGGMVDYLERRS